MSALNTLAAEIAKHLKGTEDDNQKGFEDNMALVGKIDNSIKADKAAFEAKQTQANNEDKVTETEALEQEQKDYQAEVQFYVENETEAKDSLTEMKAQFESDIATLTEAKKGHADALAARRTQFVADFGSLEDFSLEVDYEHDSPVWGDAA
jgi:chromosome segregation ATPase